jgi:tRNA threonylcarbamoyl adenosine modification protein YeaZ
MAACSLVIETSTPRASIALADTDGHVETRSFCSDRNHNAMLFEPLRELLDGRPRPEIALVLVGSGPGSYSGTRVGIAAAQGVAIAMGCPAVAVPSVLAVPPVGETMRCLAIGDARRGSYWHASINGFDMPQPPALCDASELESIVSKAVGDGGTVFSFEEPTRFPLCPDLIHHINQEFPGAPKLWRVWLAASDETRRMWTAAIPQPLYLKPPHITPSKRPSFIG